MKKQTRDKTVVCIPAGTRTLNPLIRSQVHYRLRHKHELLAKIAAEKPLARRVEVCWT